MTEKKSAPVHGAPFYTRGEEIMNAVTHGVGAVGWVLFGVVWSVVFAAVPTIQKMPVPGLILLLAGGIAYTAGIPFYRKKTVKYFHGIWHFFVLAGAVLQFFAVYLYII